MSGLEAHCTMIYVEMEAAEKQFLRNIQKLSRDIFRLLQRGRSFGEKVKCRMTRIFAFLEKVRTLAKVQIKKCFVTKHVILSCTQDLKYIKYRRVIERIFPPPNISYIKPSFFWKTFFTDDVIRPRTKKVSGSWHFSPICLFAQV